MRALWAALSLGLVLTCACAEKDPPPSGGDAASTAPEPLAVLEAINGNVLLVRGADRARPSLGYLFAGDALETREGTATLRLANGRLVELAPNTRFELGKDSEGLVIGVKQGVMVSRREANPQAAEGAPAAALNRSLSVRVLTPFGLTRVGAEPDDLSIDVRDEEARVEVRLGAVSFVSPDGQEKDVRSGESLLVAAGKVEVVSRESAIELKPMVFLVSADGKTELKARGQRSWKALPSKPVRLQEGDELRVKSGKARAAFEQSSSAVTLATGSELQFTSAGTVKGVETTVLKLRKGTAMFLLSPDHPSRVDVGGFQLESDLGGGGVTLVRTQEGVDVSAFAGDLRILRGGQAYPVTAGTRARFGKEGAPDAQSLPPSVLVLPSRSDLQVFHPNLGLASLTWEGGASDYAVLVATDAGYAQKVLVGRVHQNQVQVPIPARGALYWRIVDAATKSEVDQGNARFAPEMVAGSLARARNEVPEGTEKTTIYFQDKVPAVTFTFAPEEGAVEYVVRVFAAGVLDSAVAERRDGSTRVALEEGVLEEGAYRWSVTPMGADGKEMRGGRMNKLEIVYDNSVPSLVIHSPKNGDRAAGRLRTSGIAPVNANVIINGKPIPLDDKHRFDVAISPVGNPPALVYRLVRPSSPDVFTVRLLGTKR